MVHKILSLSLICSISSAIFCAEDVVNVSLMTAPGDFSFIADSDMQLGGEGPEETKEGHVEAILALIKDDRRAVKGLLIPGDMIEGIPSAANSSSYVAAGFKLAETLKIKKTDSKALIEAQFNKFKTLWFDPINKAFNNRWKTSGVNYIWETVGNHEYYDFYLDTVVDWVKNRHNGRLYYSFDIEGVHFCCLGIGPEEDMFKWLKSDLAAQGTKPVVIFFHYNLRGERERWWDNKQVDSFYDVIRPYIGLNRKGGIKIIIHGHNHSSYKTTWMGLPIFAVGGAEFALVDYSADDQTFEVTYCKPLDPQIAAERIAEDRKKLEEAKTVLKAVEAEDAIQPSDETVATIEQPVTSSAEQTTVDDDKDDEPVDLSLSPQSSKYKVEFVIIKDLDLEKDPDSTVKDDNKKRVERQWNWNLVHRVDIAQAITQLAGRVVHMVLEEARKGLIYLSDKAGLGKPGVVIITSIGGVATVPIDMVITSATIAAIGVDTTLSVGKIGIRTISGIGKSLYKGDFEGAGKFAYRGIQSTGKEVGKGVEKAGKETVKAVEKVGKQVGKTAKKAGKEVKKAAKKVGKAVKKLKFW